MADYDFVIADVFTDRAFGGNQLAVLTDARGLEGARMQQLAREFNFAETVFVLPPDDPRHARRLRIFTPKVELPFAGHPTVGAAAVLAELGVLQIGRPGVVEEGVGPVTVEATGREGARVATRFTLERDVELRRGEPTRDAAAAVLGLSPDDVLEAWSASVGVPFCHVHLASREAVDRAALDPAAWSDHLATAWARDVYLFAGDFASGGRLYARMFGPSVGVAEDPATGAACAGLIGALAARSGGDATLTVEQGVAMGRPSVIEAAADVEGGRVARVRLGGSSVIVARGTITA